MPIGDIPDQSMYSPEMLSTAELTSFKDWHSEQRLKGARFNFHLDILSYCFSDVVLLSEGVRKFSSQFFEQTNVRPFEESTTIASAAMQVFRRNFVIENQISITKPLTLGAKQSHLAACYLEWYAFIHKVQVQHRHRGGEFQVSIDIYINMNIQVSENVKYTFKTLSLYIDFLFYRYLVQGTSLTVTFNLRMAKEERFWKYQAAISIFMIANTIVSHSCTVTHMPQ